MADVHVLPGVLRTDLERGLPVEVVLDAVRGAGMKDVVVVGRGLDGSVHLWGTHPDADVSIALLMRGVRELTVGPQVATQSSPEPA